MVRSALALAYPDATEEGLDEGARLLLRWGSEGLGAGLTGLHADLLAEEMAVIVRSVDGIARVEPRTEPTRNQPLPEPYWRQTDATRRRRG